jgi:hypothetical protein
MRLICIVMVQCGARHAIHLCDGVDIGESLRCLTYTQQRLARERVG